ncbi:MAG: hypothetical protein J6H20_02995 [Pyramidobacter sp.]|nr:hypothetical protein [Pyramidobacter sp.]
MDDELLFKKVICYVMLSIALAFSLPVIFWRLLRLGVLFSDPDVWKTVLNAAYVAAPVAGDVYMFAWFFNAINNGRFKSHWLENAFCAFGYDAFWQTFKLDEGFTLSWVIAGAVAVAWICSGFLERSRIRSDRNKNVSLPKRSSVLQNSTPQTQGMPTVKNATLQNVPAAEDITPFYTPDGVLRGYMFDHVVYATRELAEAEKMKR